MFGQTTEGLAGTFLNVKRTTAQEVMRYRLLLMVEDMTQDKWYNQGPLPPGAELGGTAVAYNKFGKGQAVYIGVPVFWAMKDRLFWIRTWIPELMRALVPQPIAELQSEPFSEYAHGTFFWDKSKRFVLVQVLNTIVLATEGEFRPLPRVRITTDPARLNVAGARIVWPEERDLPVASKAGRTHIVLDSPRRYTALYLKLA